MRRTLEITTLFLIVLSVPWFAELSANAVWPRVQSLDPDRAFLWITVHHVFQLVFTLLAARLLFGLSLHGLGFNLGNLGFTFKSCAGFIVVYGLWVTIRTLIFETHPNFGYPLTIRNTTGVLSFQMFLSGGAEEPLYRGLLMCVLGGYWKRVYKVGSIEMPITGLIATGLFMLAHVSPLDSPPYFSFSPYQQFLSFCLGMFYAIQFHRTKSLVGPIVAHGCSNVLAVGVQYLTIL